uniref:hypothetical protein n=1 Tax=Ornithobacterium rhinotracheale TaxID=28251 RepID=UPI00162832B9|nr:hypothetical protein [Ornithobacterium rhinotracheale]
MKPYKILFSFDIQTQEGESQLNNSYPNTVCIGLDEAEAKAFNVGLVRLLLRKFSNHLYVVGLEDYHKHKSDLNRQVQTYTYELKYLPASSGCYCYRHSEVVVVGKTDYTSYYQACQGQCGFPQQIGKSSEDNQR